MDTTCPQGHPINSSADRDGQGYCLACRTDGVRTYRGRQRAALELALALEAHGVAVTRTAPPVDLRQLAAELAAGIDSEPS